MAAQSCGINVHLSTGITGGLSAGLAAIAGISPDEVVCGLTKRVPRVYKQKE